MPRRRGHALCATLLLVLAACTVGPDFTPPPPGTPPGWQDPSAHQPPGRAPDGVDTRSDPDPLWWRSFNDRKLDGVIDEAVAGNLDLQEAVFRIAEAREGEIAARAAGLPSLGASASYTREQFGLKGILEQGGAYSYTAANPAIAGILNQATQPFDLYQAGFDASWELDLFGRVRRSVEQSGAQTAATLENRNDALVSLEAEVAQTYAQLRGAQANAEMSRENVVLEQDILQLTEQRSRQGLTSDLDVQTANAELTSTEAQGPVYDRQAGQALNTLAVLVGRTPGALNAELAEAAPLPPVPPDVPIGLPASLVRRRPDIRAAEARLHAGIAGVGVAVAQLFPDVSLSGTFGQRADQAKYLGYWASNFYTIGPSISLPIFEGGRLAANVRAAKAGAAEAALDYRKTVLQALSDVENALIAYRTEQNRRRSLAASTDASKRAFDLARDRYVHGLSSFIDVLNAERTLVNVRVELIASTLAVTTDLVSLYKALGGGWQGATAAAAR
jgi:outer membrane protein, multidrug efflux system